MSHVVQTLQIPVGDKPGWEEGEDGTSVIAEDDEDDEAEPKLLKSIPEVSSAASLKPRHC